MNYIKQLDSLRAIAVLLVIIGHSASAGSTIQKIFDADFGVNIFFVLSGFLITRILLVNRKDAVESNQSLWKVFKNFYIRRTLRIFPIYYLCILIFFFFPMGVIENGDTIFPWLFTYTSNIYFFIFQKWDGHISHVWSLAVEEQFYFLWPGLMLFVKRKYLLPAICGFISVGILFQFFFRGVPFVNYFTVSCFSSFGMGALLAWIIVYKPDQLMRFYKALIIPALISIIIFIFGIIQTKWVTVPMMRPFHSIIALFIIAYIFIRKDRSGIFFSAIWDNKFLIFIGKISYGMYLYHAFLPYIINRGLVTYFNWNAEEFFSPLAYFLMSFLIVVLTAWLSWRLIEKPFLGLKKYFNYSDNTK